MFGDNFFDKVEKKTNVSKETILSIADKVKNSNMKDEATIRDLVKEIGQVAGREVSQEKTDKIVKTILNDEVPTNIDKMF